MSDDKATDDDTPLAEPTFAPALIPTEKDEPPMDQEANRAKAGGDPEAEASGSPS